MEKEVTIYTTSTCHFCEMSKAYFKEHGVNYTEFNVSTDQEKRQEMIDKSGQMGVPQIYIDGEFILGFDKKRFDEIFGAAPAAA